LKVQTAFREKNICFHPCSDRTGQQLRIQQKTKTAQAGQTNSMSNKRLLA